MRRPFRLALILAALSGGGALLLTTHSNYESLMGVIDASLATQGHDIEVLVAACRAGRAARGGGEGRAGRGRRRGVAPRDR